mgnify:CR=1 FL=1
MDARAQARLGQGGSDDEAALRGKLAACRYFICHDLPKAAAAPGLRFAPLAGWIKLRTQLWGVGEKG